MVADGAGVGVAPAGGRGDGAGASVGAGARPAQAPSAITVRTRNGGRGTRAFPATGGAETVPPREPERAGRNVATGL
ncbi:hypothetical protein rosag_10950 [Roseisolibacter agri]|uniref:Uncharacterized protein n=1 Tax=Roseisolibacter agri TaxID=2014610 RepID=A0AA37V212_9BACT|nr:hypothetical protein rosag_10950 [Roseisolibacter agri]